MLTLTGSLRRHRAISSIIVSTTSASPFHTLNDLYEKAVQEFPNQKLIGTKNKDTNTFEWITYDEFGKVTQNLKHKLHQEGFKNGDKLAIISNNSKEWAITAYAGYALGMPVVPLYPNQKKEEWDYIINDSDAKIVFAQTDEVRSGLNGIPSLSNIPVVNFENTDSNSNESFSSWCEDITITNDIENNITPQNVASLIYTSGTTGKPKGVMLTHENICSNILSVAKLFGDRIDSDTVTLSILPWAHVYGQTMELHSM